MNKKNLIKEIKAFQTTNVREEYSNLEFSIILVRPEHAGNIGSIARVMKNFNFSNLIIYNPIEQKDVIKSYNTQGFAMRAKDILMNSEIITIRNQEEHLEGFKKLMKKFDLIIASTAKGSSYRNVRRLAIFPDDIDLPPSQKPLKIAILFGRESRGLRNEEIELTDLLVRIPTGDEYPTLNLSHACGILLYEIFKKINVISLGRGEKPVLLANREEREILYRIINFLIQKLKIRTHKKDNIFFAFKNVFERALISKKELSLIMGIFSKIESILKKKELYKK